MKRLLFLAVLFVATAILSGCNRTAEFKPVANYISLYENPEELYVRTPTSSTELSFDQLSIQCLCFDYDATTMTKRNIISSKTNPDKYQELAGQFKDGTYNRVNPYPEPVMYRQTESLHIISDADFDVGHPAGTALDDLFRIRYRCLDKIMRNPYDFSLAPGQSSPGHFDKLLTEFNAERPTLIPLYVNFILTQAPAQTSTHRFTLTYTNIDGKVLSATTEPVTLKGR